MPDRVCKLCSQAHGVVKAYAKGVHEHITVLDPASSTYACELCRCCICQKCSRAFVAPQSAWSKHLILSSSTAPGCLLCPDCSNNTLPGAVPTVHMCRPAAVLQAEFSRLCRIRGGCAGCAACATLFAQVQPLAAAATVHVSNSNDASSSRYPTDPLPQQQLRQQQQPWEQDAAPSGQSPAMSWPGLNAPIPAQHTPAQPAMPLHSRSCDNTLLSGSGGGGLLQPTAPLAGWLAAPLPQQRAAAAGGSLGGAVPGRGSSAAGGRQPVAAGGGGVSVGTRTLGGSTPGAGGLNGAGGSGPKVQVTEDDAGFVKMVTAWLD